MDIILAFGANLETPFGPPRETLSAAVEALNARNDIDLDLVSSTFRSPPVGAAYQPPYYNLVAAGQTSLSPVHLLNGLKTLERAFGRRGGLCWGSRPLDIDIIDYDQKIRNWGHASNRGMARKFAPLTLPHPRMHLRPFVLRPLNDILPRWRHPVFQQTAAALMVTYCAPKAIKVTSRLEIA